MTLPLADPHAVSGFVRGDWSRTLSARDGRLYAPAAAASLLVHAALLAFLLPPLQERDEATMPAGGPAAILVEVAATSPTESVASSAAPADEAPRADEPAPSEKTPADAEPPVATAIESAEPPQDMPAPTMNEAVAIMPTPIEPPQVAPDAAAIQRAAQRQARLDEERRTRRIEQKRQERLARIEEGRSERLRLEKERARRERADKARNEAERASKRAGEGHETVNSVAATRGGTAGTAAGAAQMANWRGQVLAHLAGYKQYPSAARDRNVIGRPVVTFSLSPSGAVVSLSLVSSSGAPILDDAALSMVRRAAPFPPMPVGGGRASFTTAINYNMR